MKKLAAILLIALTLTSCSNALIADGDQYMSSIVKISQIDLDRLHQIKRSTTDTVVINYINSVKDTLKIEAYRTQGMITLKDDESFTSFVKTKEALRIYIDSLNQK
jgi:PBP1b-binding outer membrane lipoprotein LpoB